MQMSSGQWLLLVVLALLWGCSFFFVVLALREVPPSTIVLTRIGGAAILLTGLALALGYRLPARIDEWQAYAVQGLLNSVLPFLLISYGQQEIPGGLASLINATTPLWTAFAAHALTSEEKLTASRLAGVLVGIAGVGVLIGPEALMGSRASLLGMLLVLAATFSYSLAGIWGRRFKAIPPIQTASCQLICASLIVLPITLAVDQPWALAMPSGGALLALAGLTVLSTAVAYLIYFRILAVSGATNVMLVTLLIPLFAILLGTSLLGEVLYTRHALGGLVIAAALLIIDGRPLAWLGLRLARP